MGLFWATPQDNPDTWVIERKYCGFNVKFIKGDVLEQETNVLVNSIDKNILKGFSGPLAKSYLKKFGKNIIIDAKRGNSDNQYIKYGEICHSKLGNKKYLTHCALQKWNSKDCVKTYKEAIKNILIFCEKQELESISLPPIGSGNLNYPINEWSKLTFEAIKEHSKDKNLEEEKSDDRILKDRKSKDKDKDTKPQYPSEIRIINNEYVKHRDSFGQWEYWYSKVQTEGQLDNTDTDSSKSI